MANFNIEFIESDDDLSMLTQRDNNHDRNVDENDVELDMEELLNSSRDSAVLRVWIKMIMMLVVIQKVKRNLLLRGTNQFWKKLVMTRGEYLCFN